MKHFTQKIVTALLTLLVFCLPASAFNFVEVTASNSEVKKVDAGGEAVSSITLRVTLNKDEAPNGQAQLRLASDENSPVMGESAVLEDNALTQTSADPNSVWEITWRNVKAGKYKIYFQQHGGTSHTLLHEVEIVELPQPPAPKITLETKNVTCNSDGSVTVNLSGGTKPFQYRAMILRRDGSSDIRTEKKPERGWVIDGLKDGDHVEVDVTDADGRKTFAKSKSIESPVVEYYTDGSNYYVKRTGTDTFEYYTTFKMYCQDEKALAEAVDMLAKTAQVSEDGKDTWYPLEYSPAHTQKIRYGYYRYFFRLPIEKMGLDGRKPALEIKYNEICGGEKKKNFYFQKTTLSQMTYVSITSWATPTDDCGWTNTKYGVNYKFSGDKVENGRRVYYFMDDAHRYAKIYKQNGDGTWPSEPLIDNAPMWTKEFDTDVEFSIDLRPGIYKLVYSSGNKLTDFEREFTIWEPHPFMGYYASSGASSIYRSYQRKDLGIHGNTAGVVFSVYNVEPPFQVIVDRPDGKKDFVITDFCDDHEYTKTINFPQTIDFTEGNDHYSIGDLPAGKYKFTIKDQCGRSNTTDIEITDDNLRTYKPRRDNGYKDGVLAEYDCTGANNAVRFDFGTTEDIRVGGRASQLYGYVTGSYASPSANEFVYNTTPDDSKHLQGTTYFGVSYYPNLYNGAAVMPVEDQDVYSVIEKEMRTYSWNKVMNIHKNTGTEPWTPRDTPDPYYAKSYVFEFGANSTDAFSVLGSACMFEEDTPGAISVAIQDGKNVSMPATFELYEADEDGNPKGAAIKTYTASSREEANVIWSGLALGTYAVKIAYGPEGSCQSKKFVDLNDVELPQVARETAEGVEVNDNFHIDITDGAKPVHVFLPVSSSLYEVEWIWQDPTDGKNYEVLCEGNDWYPTFDKPGLYEYEVHVNYNNEQFPCDGNLVGTRTVKFHVTKNEVPNYWMGSTGGNDGTNFSVASNWTANRVPAEGEDIVFATAKNNNGQPAVNDCRLVTIGKMPLDFTARTLINESGKAMVIPGGSALYVTNGTMGFEHQRKDDGTYDPIRLKIEAGTNNKANGTFVARYQSAQIDKVYAEVQMNVFAKATEQQWQDNITGSPTFGQTFKVTGTDQFFGIPFKEMSAAQFAKSKVYLYDEAHNAQDMYFQKFTGLAKGGKMQAFKGYSIRRGESKVLPLRGYLNFEDANLQLTRKAAKVDGATGEESVTRWGLGQNLFGNSYTAPIQISSLKNLGTELDHTIYLYNTGSGADWGNAWGTDDPTGAPGTYTAVPINAAIVIGKDEIPSMQGFLLKFKDDQTVYDETAKELAISYAKNVMTTASIAQKAKGLSPDNGQETGVVHFVLRGNHIADEMWLCESEQATEGFDNGWDGSKLGVEMMPTAIYSATKDGIWQVNSTNDITKANIAVRVAGPGTYYIKAAKKNLSQYDDLKLVDCQSEMIVPFDADTLLYSFTTDAKGTFENRFVLMNTRATTFGDLSTGIDRPLEALTGDCLIYTLSGALVGEVSLPQERKAIESRLAPGVYIVATKDGGRQTGRKLVITRQTGRP